MHAGFKKRDTRLSRAVKAILLFTLSSQKTHSSGCTGNHNRTRQELCDTIFLRLMLTWDWANTSCIRHFS